MKIVGARVDALWIAYRVELDPLFRKRLDARARVATQHGRAAFEWIGEVSGEIRPSQRNGKWNLTREPYWRMQIDEHAAGGGEMRDCGACRGKGRTIRGGECDECDGIGRVEGIGFSVQIIWNAIKLSDWGLDRCLKESRAIAEACGRVLEARVQRIDLAVDVDDWTIDVNEMIARLAKRPRAKWSEEFQPCQCGKPRGLCVCDQVSAAGTGSLAGCKATGLSVGRGGAMMARIYDKRAELAARRDDAKIALEHGIWRAANWDGESAVTRVEFQLRGCVLKELGLRDPDCCTQWDAGRKLWMPVTTDDGEILGLVDRLDWVWRTCLDWVRLVVPLRTRNGKLRPASRLPLDPRWMLLHEVTFAAARAPSKIKRVRVRSSASAAQSLGVGLSQHARDQRLSPMPEGREAYAHWSPAMQLRVLRGRLRRIKLAEVERVLTYLVERGGDLAGALDHLATRNNAARARFQETKCAAVDEGLRCSLYEHHEGPHDFRVDGAPGGARRKPPRVFERMRVEQQPMAFA